jgi:hypothetical protein
MILVIFMGRTWLPFTKLGSGTLAGKGDKPIPQNSFDTDNRLDIKYGYGVSRTLEFGRAWRRESIEKSLVALACPW